MVPLLLFLILLVLAWPILAAILYSSAAIYFGLLIVLLGGIAIFAPATYRHLNGKTQAKTKPSRMGFFSTPDQWKVPPADTDQKL